MSIKIKTIVVGFLEVNCYIVWDSETLKGIIIDPGDNANDILSFVKENNLNIRYIFNTHGHVDHIGANNAVKTALNCKVGIHPNDKEMLGDSFKNGADFLMFNYTRCHYDLLLADNYEIKVNNFSIKVIHTPGHSQGGICFLIPKEKILFSGDTLFSGGIGRADFYGGDYKQLISSIEKKLFVLDPQTKVYPGHGEPTTIAKEKESNPFFK